MYKNAFLKNNSEAIKKAQEYETENGISELSSLLTSYESARLDKDTLSIGIFEYKIQEILIKYQNKMEKTNEVAS